MKWISTLLLSLSLAVPALAQQDFLAETPEFLLEAGKALEGQGDWRAALTKYQAATAAQPTLMEAHLGAARCLRHLISQTQRQQERLSLVKAVRERYAAAAQCAEADWKLYVEWATLLVEYQTEETETPEQRRLRLAEARSLTDTALLMAPAGDARTEVELQLAKLLVLYSHEIGDREQQRKLYQESLKLFESVAEAAPAQITPVVEQNWALALLHAGRLAGDQEQQRRALTRLQALVAADPDGVVKRYNLACAHAVLAEEEPALKNLGVCLAKDRHHQILQAARADPEWEALRAGTAFSQLLARYEPAADAFYNAGWGLQTAADRSVAADVSRENYRQAIAQYEKATTIRADFPQAYWNAGLCYQKLAKLQGSRDEMLVLAQAAHQQFSAAANCSGVEWRLFYQWGGLLLRDVASLFDKPADQLAILKQARTVLEQGLKLASFSSDQARVQSELGTCLVRMGQVTEDKRERVACFEGGIKLLEQAVKVEEVAASARPYASWGVAHLELARLDRNRLQLRRAVERLQTAAEKDPADAEVHYNLACTYTLLGMNDEALRQLSQCLAFDRSGKYATIALNDRDLAALRNDPQFAQVLNLQPAVPSTFDPSPARISGE